MVEGACLCGRIQYAVEGDIGEVSHCHCSMCQRIHGAAFGTYGAVPREKFRWLSGSDLVQVYQSSASMDRTFCSVCGSTLQAILNTEIFVGSKAPWYEITDDLPQHETWSYTE